MNKRLIYTQPNGSVAVVIPAPDARAEVVIPAVPGESSEIRRIETDEEFLERIAARSIPAGVAYTVVDAEQVPADRTYRDAWQAAGAGLVVDMDRARSIHRDRMRVKRKPMLEALDVDYVRADERGDPAAKAQVVARKQALRDAPADPRIDAAQTPEELKAVWPRALNP